MTPTLVLRTPGDVYSLINSGTLRPRRATMVAAVALGSIFLDGWDLGSFGIGTVQISHTFHLSSQSKFGFQSLPFLSAAVLMGALVGGLVGGYFTDRVGRRKMFLIDLVLLFVVTILSATAPTVGLFWFWRFLMGVAVGMDVPVALAFIAEFNAISSKGRNVMLAQVMSTGASVVLFLVMIPIYAAGVGDSLWRYAIGLGAVPAVIVLVLRFFYTSESPLWSATYEGLDQAAEIIKKTYLVDEIVVDEHQPAARQVQRAAVRPRAILELFTTPYGIRTLLVSILVVTQAVEFYGISLYTPKILTAMLGDRIELVLLLSAVANVFGVAGAIGCVLTVQHLGLRRLAVLGYAVTFGCLAVISGAYPLLAIPVATVLIWIFYAGHNFGPGYAGTAMGSLSYPTNIRGISGGYTQAITRVGGIIGAYAFPVLLSAVGQRATIGYIALAPLIGLLFVLLIKWDPIGQDVEVTIQDTGARDTESRTLAQDS
jgi:MFS transporter, putative metabolite transport protein